MRKSIRHGLAGVTLTELLVVLAIIGLLATMSIPAVINRSAQAKFTAARADVETLAKAEESCGLIHGFYVPLQLLDDIPTPSSGNIDTQRDDYIGNELTRGIRLIDVEQSAYDQFIFNNQPLLLPLNNAMANRVRQLIDKWQGPFINFQRTFVQDQLTSSDVVAHDHPLDPWGNPYRLYSPEGLTGSSTAGTGTTPVSILDMQVDSFSNGVLTTTDDRFDRYAIVSYGPNGLADPSSSSIGGAGTGAPDFGDDIIYFFGANPADETSFQVVATPTP